MVRYHTLRAARDGEPVKSATLRKIAAATVELRNGFLRARSETEELLDCAREAMIDVGGRNAFARLIEVDAAYLGRVLSGQRPPSEALLERFRDLRRQY